MNTYALSDRRDLEMAAHLAARNHEALRRTLPFLPIRDAAHFLPRIAWMAREGELLGLRTSGELHAFLGGFILENFRNAGMGAFCPDWCHGSAKDISPFDAYRTLYREAAPLWKARGADIHCIGLYATETEVMEAFSMTGFGRIVMDAARPVDALLAELEGGTACECHVRRASAADAPVLAELNASLASHIAAPPVFMPHPTGMSVGEWMEWFTEPGAVSFLSTSDGVVTGYIKAQDPQIDVTDAVQDARTLAINGAFVNPLKRGHGSGKALLLALARHAREAGKALLSVDCETLNLEAYTFWSRGFRHVTWGLERRT